MKRIAIVAMGLAFGAQNAGAAESVSGSGALALAALVGTHSPHVGTRGKLALWLMLDGRLDFRSPAGGRIVVAADSVTCRSSNVDISGHDCTIKFGVSGRTLRGRAAHELYATLIEAGVPSDGAAGSIFESLADLSCTINPDEVKEKGGGGAACTFEQGP